MKQLTGMDASFLYMESETQFGHVSGLSIFARPDDSSYDPYTAWRARLQERLPLLEPLRRRLVEVPLGLDHPFWADDPHFDIEYHVRHELLPTGTDDELTSLVGDIIARPLDRSHPLWESYVIEGLSGERFAVLTKVHHAAVDGGAGVELLTLMLDDVLTVEAPAAERARQAWRPDQLPTSAEVMTQAALSLVRKPGRALLLSTRLVRDVGRATRNPVIVSAARQLRSGLRGPVGAVLNRGRDRELDPEPIGPLPQAAPATPFNGPISPHRSVALGSVPLSTVKAIKTALGATVNDVVLAVCAGGLRSWLERHDALPDGPLVVVVPVSLRTDDDPDRWTNRVSITVASLPTDEPDPETRVKRVHESMTTAKQLFEAVPAEALTDFTQFPPPAVFALAMRAAASMSRRYRPAVNLTVSNVPGPRQPLYAAGAQLLHYYPV